MHSSFPDSATRYESVVTVGDERRDRPYYGPARIVLAGVLVGLFTVLAIQDSISVDYELSPVLAGLILGTAAGFLGLEILRKVMGP